MKNPVTIGRNIEFRFFTFSFFIVNLYRVLSYFEKIVNLKIFTSFFW